MRMGRQMREGAWWTACSLDERVDWPLELKQKKTKYFLNAIITQTTYICTCMHMNIQDYKFVSLH